MENKKLTKKEKTDFIMQYVKNELGYMKKDDLRKTLKEMFNTELKKNATKDELIQAVIKNCKNRKKDYLKIYEMWKFDYFGVSLSMIEETFNISRYKRKQLEKYYILDVMYTYETRAYGTYIDVPMYCLEDFLNLLGQDIDAILKKERKINKK